jgi:hypothetical protein
MKISSLMGRPMTLTGRRTRFEQLKLIAETAMEKAKKYREAVRSYQDLASKQKGTVLTMFKKARQDVDQYLRSNGIGQAQNYLG